MAHDPEIRRILCQHLHDSNSSFSIGSLGAIAEFHRDAEEFVVLDIPERLMIATGRGALRIDLIDGVTPLAYETLSGRPGRWQHGVVFCLPETLAASHGRTTLTELGPDHDAVRAEDRDAILFDLGLGARNVDFCFRTNDPELLSFLRYHVGRSILDPGNRAMSAIVEASPHRIAVSKLGRAEVYQAIDKIKTPDGPHTHVLPRLLGSGRTHSANIPVASDHLPCLSLYPANPLCDGNGRERAFDRATLAAFQTLLDRWGVPDYCVEKARIVNALHDGCDPYDYERPRTWLSRIGLRVALRQMSQINGGDPILHQWSMLFDSVRAEIGENQNEI